MIQDKAQFAVNGCSLNRRRGQVFCYNISLIYTFPMARPLRTELAGLVYHITSREDRQEAIYMDDQDRRE